MDSSENLLQMELDDFWIFGLAQNLKILRANPLGNFRKSIEILTFRNPPTAPEWAGLGLISGIDITQNRLRIPNL